MIIRLVCFTGYCITGKLKNSVTVLIRLLPASECFNLFIFWEGMDETFCFYVVASVFSILYLMMGNV